MTDINEHMAAVMETLVSDLKQNDVKAFEERCLAEREARAALRAQQADPGLNASELLKLGVEDDETRLAKIDAQLTRERDEAKAAVDAKEKLEELPADRFPPPILTT